MAPVFMIAGEPFWIQAPGIVSPKTSRNKKPRVVIYKWLLCSNISCAEKLKQAVQCRFDLQIIRLWL
jgi:hypothetical protein